MCTPLRQQLHRCNLRLPVASAVDHCCWSFAPSKQVTDDHGTIGETIGFEKPVCNFAVAQRVRARETPLLGSGLGRRPDPPLLGGGWAGDRHLCGFGGGGLGEGWTGNHTHIYIYNEREGERERETENAPRIETLIDCPEYDKQTFGFGRSEQQIEERDFFLEHPWSTHAHTHTHTYDLKNKSVRFCHSFAMLYGPSCSQKGL